MSPNISPISLTFPPLELGDLSNWDLGVANSSSNFVEYQLGANHLFILDLRNYPASSSLPNKRWWAIHIKSQKIISWHGRAPLIGPPGDLYWDARFSLQKNQKVYQTFWRSRQRVVKYLDTASLKIAMEIWKDSSNNWDNLINAYNYFACSPRLQQLYYTYKVLALQLFFASEPSLSKLLSLPAPLLAKKVLDLETIPSKSFMVWLQKCGHYLNQQEMLGISFKRRSHWMQYLGSVDPSLVRRLDQKGFWLWTLMAPKPELAYLALRNPKQTLRMLTKELRRIDRLEGLKDDYRWGTSLQKSITLLFKELVDYLDIVGLEGTAECTSWSRVLEKSWLLRFGIDYTKTPMGVKLAKSQITEFRVGRFQARQLVTSDELIQETCLMHHCVATRWESCQAGKEFIYAISSGKKRVGTVSFGPDGDFKEVHGAYNRSLSLALECSLIKAYSELSQHYKQGTE